MIHGFCRFECNRVGGAMSKGEEQCQKEIVERRAWDDFL